MNEVLEIISNEVHIALAPWIIMAIIAGAQAIGGAIQGGIQNKAAKDIKVEGDKYKKYGMEGMEALLADRQQQYNNIWKMIYGGVKNFDFSSMSPPGVSMGGFREGERSGNRQGATDSGSGGAPPAEKKPQGKGDIGKDYEWWTQDRLPHESEF